MTWGGCAEGGFTGNNEAMDAESSLGKIFGEEVATGEGTPFATDFFTGGILSDVATDVDVVTDFGMAANFSSCDLRARAIKTRSAFFPHLELALQNRGVELGNDP